MKKWTLKIVLYFVLILGYIFLYVIDVEELVYDQKDIPVKSNVDFVYQQF